MDSRTGQGLYKMCLKHLVVTENKEMLKKQNDGFTSKGHRSQLKELLVAKAGIICARK